MLVLCEVRCCVAEPEKVRELTAIELHSLRGILRRGRLHSVRVLRALIILASASGTPETAIAQRLSVQVETVREVIRAFNESGMASMDPHQAGGRPRLTSRERVPVGGRILVAA